MAVHFRVFVFSTSLYVVNTVRQEEHGSCKMLRGILFSPEFGTYIAMSHYFIYRFGKRFRSGDEPFFLDSLQQLESVSNK